MFPTKTKTEVCFLMDQSWTPKQKIFALQICKENTFGNHDRCAEERRNRNG